MNREYLVAAIASLGLSFAQPAAAQVPDTSGAQAGVKVGWLWPHSDLKESFGSTYVLGADLSYRGKVIGAGVDARFSRKKTDIQIVEDILAEVTWTSIPLSGNIYLNLFLDQGNTLYVGGGPTYMYTRIEASVLADMFPTFSEEREGRWDWGWNAVVGADSGRAFIEGQYLWVKGSLEPEETSGTEPNLGGFSLSLGIRF